MKQKTDYQLHRMWRLGMQFGCAHTSWFAQLCCELSDRRIIPWHAYNQAVGPKVDALISESALTVRECINKSRRAVGIPGDDFDESRAGIGDNE